MGEENKRICPVLSSGILDDYPKCKEGNCAWWDLVEKMCVVKSGFISLRHIAENELEGASRE